MSLVVTLLLSSPLSFLYKTFDAAGAPFIEEPAKILVVVLVLWKISRYKWILNGLLIGAAVGAGFGAFESAGYAFEAMIAADPGTIQVQAGIDSIVVRGMLAPFMHVIWTANAAAGIWMVKGDKPFEWNMLLHPKFLRVFLLSVALHFVWNSNFGLVKIPVFADLKYLLLGIISWTIGFMIIQTGLKQLNEARKAELDRLKAA
jgi:RsiW-degrading membrane proteinase PrsW (M82 family)